MLCQKVQHIQTYYDAIKFDNMFEDVVVKKMYETVLLTNITYKIASTKTFANDTRKLICENNPFINFYVVQNTDYHCEMILTQCISNLLIKNVSDKTFLIGNYLITDVAKIFCLKKVSIDTKVRFRFRLVINTFKMEIHKKHVLNITIKNALWKT